MKTKLILTALAVLIAASCYGGFEAGSFWQSRQDRDTQRKTAIAYECGQYNAKTGSFEWIKPVPQITAAMLNMPEVLPAHPVPSRKPKATK